MGRRKRFFCFRSLPLNADNFARDKNRIAGLSYSCKSCDKIRTKKCRKKNRKKHNKISRVYKKKYPEKVRAHSKVRSAIKSGLIKQKPCEYCSNPKSEAHHPDYSKPLSVIWLCNKHHNELHKWEKLLSLKTLPN